MICIEHFNKRITYKLWEVKYVGIFLVSRMAAVYYSVLIQIHKLIWRFSSSFFFLYDDSYVGFFSVVWQSNSLFRMNNFNVCSLSKTKYAYAHICKFIFCELKDSAFVFIVGISDGYRDLFVCSELTLNLKLLGNKSRSRFRGNQLAFLCIS